MQFFVVVASISQKHFTLRSRFWRTVSRTLDIETDCNGFRKNQWGRDTK